MLDKLDSLYSYAITKIQTLVSAYHTFCKKPDILDYFAKLLEKNKFLYNDIKNVSNKRHYYRGFVCRLTNYI